jgi:hypothetical protein
MAERDSFLQVLSIEVPKTTAWEPERDVMFTLSLFSLPTPLSLAIVASHENIGWRILARRDLVETLQSAVFANHRLADVTVKSMLKAPIGYYNFPLQAAAPFSAPMAYFDDFRKVDPLNGILGAMSNLREGESIIYQLTLQPVTQKQFELGWKTIQTSAAKWWQFLTPVTAGYALTGMALGAKEYPKYVPELQRAAEDKLRANLMQTTFELKVKAATPQRADEILALLAPGLAGFEREGHNYLVPMQQGAFPLILTANEIAALWHFPNERCDVPGVRWTPAVRSPLTAKPSKKQDGVKLGVNQYQGRERDVWLDYPDRVTHVNIIGKTRTGKSTLMQHMIHQDIAAGKGVGVIDPHGALVDSILATSIPPGREKDVILFDIGDEEYPIGLNLLSGPENLKPGVIAGQALSVIRKMFAENWSSSRMEDALHSALMAATAVDDATIQTIAKLFYNSGYRAEALQTVNDPITLEFWYYEYEPLTAAHQREIARPITHRLRKFYRNDAIRPVVCQPNSLDFRAMLDEGKIFLAKLGGIPDIDAETLGALLVSKFQMAAMSRTELSPGEIAEYYLYIDEVQNFVMTSLPQMLSEAGKFGLRLVVANQFLRQLEGATLEAVMGNAGTTIMFALGPKDASALAPFVKPVHTSDDLANLDRFQSIVKMQTGGKTLPAFSLSTQPPIQRTEDSAERVARIRDLSRQKYARPRVEVEEEFVERFHEERLRLVQESGAEVSYLG